MNPVIIIPTYVGGKRKTPGYNVVATYDHTTPLTHQGELSRCLTSLVDNEVAAPVVVLVVAERGVEREASLKVQGILENFAGDLALTMIDTDVLVNLYGRVEKLGLAAIKDGVSLTGYGSVRNFGLLIAAVLGYTEAIFIDDDETVDAPDFIERAVYGLGKLTKNGSPVLVKSGFWTDRQGKWKSGQKAAWYNHFWKQGELFNEWITRAMTGARLSRSNGLYGGLTAIHREAFLRVSFDPWISRGEDLDYLLNIRMYGGDVWFDNKWSINHLPPTERNEAQRFRQDIYRWIYEQRKLEFSKSQIDLLPIKPRTLDPYPGPFLEHSVSRRVFVTALLRMLGRADERKGYFRAALTARREAKAYAEVFCNKYFEFQMGWPQTINALEGDIELKALFKGARVGAVVRADEYLLASAKGEAEGEAEGERFDLDIDALGL